MSQFTVFQELPKELRDQIWDLAIRDHSPAAHFFTIYDAGYDGKSVVHPEKRAHGARHRDRPTKVVGLAAPHGRGTNDLSWVHGNESTYMTDSGLWTACWESRRRMLWRFRPTTTSTRTEKSTNAVTMRFRRDNGERQYLTVQPKGDLLCLQFAGGSQISPENGDFWGCIQALPPFQRRESPARPYIRDIAVEVDPAWVSGPRPQATPHWPIRGFLLAGDMHKLARFWFINYSLERRYRPEGAGRKRRTFQAGGGLELVEVRDGDDEWWDRSGGPDSEKKEPPGSSVVHRLARYFEDFQPMTVTDEDEDESSDDSSYENSEDGSEDGSEYDSEYDSDEDSGEDSNEDSNDDEPLLEFRVLACVRRDSENHLPTKSEWEEQWIPDFIPGEEKPGTPFTGFANNRVDMGLTSRSIERIADMNCRKKAG